MNKNKIISYLLIVCVLAAFLVFMSGCQSKTETPVRQGNNANTVPPASGNNNLPAGQGEAPADNSGAGSSAPSVLDVPTDIGADNPDTGALTDVPVATDQLN